MPHTKSSKPGILIYGAGGQAKVIWDAIEKMGRFEVAAYIVDREPEAGERYLDSPVLSADQVLKSPETLPQNVALAIGDNAARQAAARRVEAAGFHLPVIIHPMTSIGANTVLGDGTLMCAGALLDPYVSIGKGSILNAGSAVGHDTRTEDFVHICGGTYVGARCYVKELAFVGLRASVLPDLTIGRNSIVGAGALVTKDVPDEHLAVGNPARFRNRSTHTES